MVGSKQELYLDLDLFMTTFKSLGLSDTLTNALKNIHITVPTPIQTQAIPEALAGHDVLASAQTGTGKTMAYALPLLATDENSLILAPTREIATQVEKSIRQLLPKKEGFHTALIIGGESMGKQLFALKKHPRMVIGTPGRVNDHLKRGTLKLGNFSKLVLDETDRMLDMGFSEAIDDILKHLPQKRQTLMFSATMPSMIVKLSQKYLIDPKHIEVGSRTEPTAQVKQESIRLGNDEKFSKLLHELNEREGSAIVFVKTKWLADQLAEKLQKNHHEAEAIHGDLRQRKRDQVIRAFRSEKIRILVATDIAARGLDVPHVMHVINYDLPQCPEDYIHRIGRTGRAGAEGFALSFISRDDEYQWKRIQKMIGGEDVPPEPFKRSGNRNTNSRDPKKPDLKKKKFFSQNSQSKDRKFGKPFSDSSRKKQGAKPAKRQGFKK